MSVRVELPLTEQAGGFLDKAALRRLRSAAVQRDPSLPKGHAMAVLAAQPGGPEELEKILQDDKQLPRFRSLAATLLWKLGSRAAQDVLIRGSNIRDEQVLSTVLTALGRMGDQLALDAVKKAAGHATGSAAKQALFAQTLIQHRLGLDGQLPPIEGEPMEPGGEAARPFEVLKPAPEEHALAIRSLEREPFGIEYSPNAFQIRCGRNAWMLLLNRESLARERSLTERPALAGVIASRQEENHTYSVRFLILTSPERRESVRITGFTTLGDPAFTGTASVPASDIEFAVTAVSRPGAFAFRLEAALGPRGVEVRKAVTGVFVEKRRQPTPDIRPEQK